MPSVLDTKMDCNKDWRIVPSAHLPLLDDPSSGTGFVWGFGRALRLQDELVGLRGDVCAPGPGQAWDEDLLLEHMRSAILWEWSPRDAWRWGRTLLDFLVERATLAMGRLGDWDLEDISYHLAQLTRFLGILCLTEGRADLCLAVLVAGE